MVDSLQTAYAARLRAAREGKRFSQEEFAEALDCHPETVSRWERAARFPKPAELESISRVLAKPVAWFFLRGEESIANEERPQEATPLEALDILRAHIVRSEEVAADLRSQLEAARSASDHSPEQPALASHEDVGAAPNQNPDSTVRAEESDSTDAQKGRRRGEPGRRRPPSDRFAGRRTSDSQPSSEREAR